MKIKDKMVDIVGKVALGKVIKKPGKRETRSSILKELLDCPDDFRLEAMVIDGEIVIKIKKKEGIEP